ncbi:MAG: Phage portal protein [Oscillospiraceae bacterium]|jgi:uncharacterized protein YmfQ (DUF2313 family)
MSYGASEYGTYKYGEDNITSSDIKICTPDLMSLLPWYYQGSSTISEFQNSVAIELGKLRYNLEDLINQLFVDTATWGLSLWEQILGLQTNLSLSYEERREFIKARLRGRGTTTKQMIKETAEAFSGGDVDVIEYPEEYKFIVKFIGVKGIPQNMQAFIDMLETIKPAHLAYEFRYTYTVWDHLKDLTWKQTNTMTWNDLKAYEGE